MWAKLEAHDKLHSVESAAEFLGGVSPYTIRAWLTEGRLTRIKVGRLTRVRDGGAGAKVCENLATSLNQ